MYPADVDALADRLPEVPRGRRGRAGTSRHAPAAGCGQTALRPRRPRGRAGLRVDLSCLALHTSVRGPTTVGSPGPSTTWTPTLRSVSPTCSNIFLPGGQAGPGPVAATSELRQRPGERARMS